MSDGNENHKISEQKTSVKTFAIKTASCFSCAVRSASWKTMPLLWRVVSARGAGGGGEAMSKLDDMIEAQARAMANAWPKDQHEVVVHDLTLMATFLRTDTAFRAMCEERLERLEAEWESAREDMWQDHKNARGAG